MLNTKFQAYVDGVAAASSDCAAALKRMLGKGPPVRLSVRPLVHSIGFIYYCLCDDIQDSVFMPVEDPLGAFALWFASDGEVHSAQLKGALLGEERAKYIAEQEAGLAALLVAEGAAQAAGEIAATSTTA